jgi:hypothetical protein
LWTVFCRRQYFFAVACNLCNVNAIFAMSMRSLRHHKDRCNIAHKRLNLTKNLYNCPIDCVIPSLVTRSNEDVGDRDARDGLLDVVSDLRERLMGGFGINLSESMELQYLHYLAGTSHDDREIRGIVDAILIPGGINGTRSRGGEETGRTATTTTTTRMEAFGPACCII